MLAPRLITAMTILACGAIARAQFAVTTVSPTLNASNVLPNTTLSVTFDRAVNPATFTSANFNAFGKLSGPVAGPLAFSNANKTVTLTPSRPFLTGEQVLLVMSHNLRAADATFLRQAGYTATFMVRAIPSFRTFRKIAEISNRTNNGTGPQTRIYGGVACDLDRDGFSDITTVNEVSADLRVFLNRGDGTIAFDPMLTPFTDIPDQSSPNEVADFNADGFIDIVTSSGSESQIAICLGDGDGTFATPILRNVGSNPRGFGIIDVDGDGDMDITVANGNSNNISLIINTGLGTFSNASNFTVPGNNGAYGMTAADMNNDGILDLVVGCRISETAAIMRGVGNGTFAFSSSRNLGGANWVVSCGDLNNDGNMDVSAANSFSENGSILLGNGNGTLQAATVFSIGGHSVSTDLTDLDGDGDLDWIHSSYGAGTWYAYLNNGAGAFTPFQEFPAPSNPSCAVPVDIDNDGDIDLVLTDEIADLLVVMGNVCPADFDNSGSTGTPDGGVDINDLLYFLVKFEAGNVLVDLDNGSSTGLPDGGVDISDLLYFLIHFESGC